MRIVLSALCVAVLLSGCADSNSSGGAIPAGAEAEAVAAAEAWVALIDAGKYRESHEAAAPYFKAALDANGWEQTAAAVRGPLGSVVSRTVRSTTYTTEVPGAPDGEYVIIQFDTSFENKKSATETITPMRDESGVWRAAGYYIN